MNFQPLTTAQHLKSPGATRLHYAPGEGERTPEAGIELLREVARDIPVSLVRLEGGRPEREMRLVKSTEISAGKLIPKVTAYAVAFKLRGVLHLIVVSRSALR